MDVQVAGPEAGFGVGEVEVPHALEGGTEPEPGHGVGGAAEAGCRVHD
jgi:hypothetical protein